LAPLSESGGAVELEIAACVKVTFLVEMIANGGVYGGEILQGSRSPEAQHCPLSSSKWPLLVVWKQTTARQWVRILSAVILPTAGFLSVRIADDLHRGTTRSEFVGHDDMRPAIAFHCFSEKFQCRFAISALRDKTLNHLTFVITSPSRSTPLQG
jgi:hypothetical protein